MRIVGVIAEYNPFHSGHAHQLRQAREAAHADAVVAVMSGCFVQRGDAAIVSPAIRAKMALQNGADAVILLPALWSVRDAEHKSDAVFTNAFGNIRKIFALCSCLCYKYRLRYRHFKNNTAGRQIT